MIDSRKVDALREDCAPMLGMVEVVDGGLANAERATATGMNDRGPAEIEAIRAPCPPSKTQD